MYLFLGGMQHTLWFLAALILVLTYYVEKDELFITKLAHRWYMFTLSVITLHLWARGSSWKMSVLHTTAILAAFKVDTSKPTPGDSGLLWQISLSLVAVIVSFNPNRHVRQLWPPFNIQHTDEEHPMPPVAHDILAEVEFISPDDSDEDEVEEHLPFDLILDGPFILGPPTSPMSAPPG